jgi:hypothetical protein
MGTCSSRTCPEARIAYAKFWFTDGGVNWRLDWDEMRVLRMKSDPTSNTAPNTWYIIADECDGTDVAALIQMNGKNTKGVITGYYKVPLFIRVVALQ